MKRLHLIPALLALLLALPASASAASGSQSFMGVSGHGLDFRTDSSLNAGLKAMRSRGVGTVRVTFYWSGAQPYGSFDAVPADQRSRYTNVDGRPTDWSDFDRVVGLAARRGLTVLPVVTGTPYWASTIPGKTFAPPDDPQDFGDFHGSLVRRYGPNGSFWTENPSIRKVPIRYWQVWNEPAGQKGFGDRTFSWEGPLDQAITVYKTMLKAARTEIKAADKNARVVLAGLFGESWVSTAQAYDAGYRKYFDVIAIHPYARLVSEVVRILELVRAEMRRNGDGSKPLMVTEFSWSSSKGKLSDNLGLDYIERSEAGQASALRSAYRTLYAKRRTLRLRAAYWFTWATAGRLEDNPFDYVGLNRLRGDQTLDPKPAAKAYTKAAKELRDAR